MSIAPPRRGRAAARPSLRLSLAAGLALSATAPAFAQSRTATSGTDILVVAQRQTASIENVPASRAAVDADTIATTINARNVEDTLKYLPSLVVRKRHIGDSQAPLATRTSGLGASARSLIYADGALLSALVGNNNTTASPRWNLVSTEEIARVDVIYGPFSAAYPGNSIGAVVNITTRLPERLEATLVAGTSVQQFDLYATRRTLPAYQLGGTIGDRFGPLALFASADHVDSRSQPLGFATATRPAATGTTGVPTTGGFDDVNRTGGPIRVFGATGFEHQTQDRFKLKAALDLTAGLRLTYVGSLFLNDTNSTVETYLTGTASGLPVFAGSVVNDGRAYTIAASTFAGQTYHTDQRQWSHNLSLTGTGRRVDWQVIGTLYDVAKDEQRIANTALPAGATGGAGFITDLAGTGWKTIDAKASWRSDAAATHTLAAGIHGDWFTLSSNRYNTADWVSGGKGTLNLVGSGRTRTLAVWGQDAWRVAAPLTLTLGGRYEWWRAYDGANFAQSPAIGPVAQPTLTAARFSPKAALALAIAPGVTTRLSLGQAWRFPTVGELYQIVTTPVASVPNPNLRPERARSGDWRWSSTTATARLRAVAVRRGHPRRADLADRPARRHPGPARHLRPECRPHPGAWRRGGGAAHRHCAARRPVGQRHLCRCRHQPRHRLSGRDRQAVAQRPALESDRRRHVAPSQRRRADRRGPLRQPQFRHPRQQRHRRQHLSGLLQIFRRRRPRAVPDRAAHAARAGRR